MAKKVTFSLDDATVALIRSIAEREKRPQSQVLREAVAAYGAQEQKLDAATRERKLRLLEELMAQPPTRPQREVDKELRQIRRGRRVGWRRPSD
jgi:predicted transcriptional regulator